MPAVTVDIADAILDALAAHAFSVGLTVARKYVPVLDLRDIDGVHVTVVPRSVGITNADRSRCANEVAVDVAIQRKLPAIATADVDPMMDLVQEIADFLTRLKLAAVPAASWLRIANTPIYAPDHMQEKRMFTSVLTVTYIMHR